MTEPSASGATDDATSDATGDALQVPVPVLSADDALAVVRDGEIEILGRMPYSSNATFLALARDGDTEMAVVYKPQRGERPLWDFPTGTLARREVASYLVSDALGWDVIPTTVLRDGPLGIGMVQQFVDHDPNDHYFTLFDDYADAFKVMAAFDVMVNNADRKGGHCLLDRRGDRIVGIDHGLTFHVEPKLRTVIWDFGGEAVPDSVLGDVSAFRDRLDDSLGAVMSELLDPIEVEALAARTDFLLETRVYPYQEPGYHTTPWPLV